ncbi:MAG: cation diffusion facilitator family transporter, partial [Gemmatimonadota bacterium]|nr:cation diffusion facilitator family transporter [Gemmatimonadota bacterium]
MNGSVRPAPWTPERHRAVRRVLWITLALNVVLVAAKAAVGLATGTLSVVAEAAQSSVDGGNNLLALVLARIASRDPDAEHPYGHAKFETLGALAIVAILSITVFELSAQALRRLASGGGDPEASVLTIGVMLISAAVSAGVSRYETRRGHALGSDLLLADAAHTRADVYA